MKILGEARCSDETNRYHHDVLGASEIPYASMKTLEGMFVRLDLQVTQVRFSDCTNYLFLTEVDDKWEGTEEIRLDGKARTNTRHPVDPGDVLGFIKRAGVARISLGCDYIPYEGYNGS